MAAFLKALILLPIALIAVLLAIANRGPVTLSLDPFTRDAPEIAFTLPLFAVIFGSVMLGVIVGGVGAWFAQAKHRRDKRRYRREIQHLRSEAERLRSRPAAVALPSATSSSSV